MEDPFSTSSLLWEQNLFELEDPSSTSSLLWEQGLLDLEALLTSLLV